MAKRLRPLALQATAAERAEKLGVEIAGLRAGIATLDIGALSAQIESADARRATFAAQKRKAEEALEAILAERTRAEEALAEAAGGLVRGHRLDALPPAQRCRAPRVAP